MNKNSDYKYYAGFTAISTGGTPVFTNCCNAGDMVYESSEADTTVMLGGFAGATSGAYTNCYSSGNLTLEGNGTCTMRGFAYYPVSTFQAENCYYNDTYAEPETTGLTGKPASAFASGEVTYLLNGSQSDAGSVWRQNLGIDITPQLTGKIVYYDAQDKTYYNVRQEHRIIITETASGTVKTNVSSAPEGTTITLTIAPEAGYMTDTVSIKTNTNEIIPVSDNTFVMPDADVSLTVTFRKVSGHKYSDGICTDCGRLNVNLAGSTLTLEEMIGCNFYFMIDEAILTNETASVQFTIPGDENTETTVTIPACEGKVSEDGELYMYTHKIFAKQMADVIQVKVTVERDGLTYESETYEYSVVSYADQVLNDVLKEELGETKNEELKTLVKAMLQYGAAAQIYFQYHTDNLANAGIEG